MICSYCYEKSRLVDEIEVGHWWNNESFLAVVCSEKCKNELWKILQNKTWMNHAPFIKKIND